MYEPPASATGVPPSVGTIVLSSTGLAGLTPSAVAGVVSVRVVSNAGIDVVTAAPLAVATSPPGAPSGNYFSFSLPTLAAGATYTTEVYLTSEPCLAPADVTAGTFST
jgi:hypothetical protein